MLTLQVSNRVNGKLNQMSENRLTDYSLDLIYLLLFQSLIVFTSKITFN